MTKISIPRGSVEYIHAPVTADVDLDMTVSIAITTGTNAHAWLPAEWTGTLGTTRTARTTDAVTFSAANYPSVKYRVYVKLDDTPETPIIEAGELVLTQ